MLKNCYDKQSRKTCPKLLIPSNNVCNIGDFKKNELELLHLLKYISFYNIWSIKRHQYFEHFFSNDLHAIQRPN